MSEQLNPLEYRWGVLYRRIFLFIIVLFRTPFFLTLGALYTSANPEYASLATRCLISPVLV